MNESLVDKNKTDPKLTIVMTEQLFDIVFGWAECKKKSTILTRGQSF